MNRRITVFLLSLGLYAAGAIAQDRALPAQLEETGGHPPPPQAYEDCRGKQAGDAVQHRTPEGVVAATCEDSPEGLVARPKQPSGNRHERPSRQGL